MTLDPTYALADNYDFVLKKYKEGLRRATQQNFGDQDNNLQGYEIVHSHCTPSMVSKLEMMAGWIKVQEDQDGMGLIKLVCGAIFAQDGSRQSIDEYMSAMKKTFLLFQGKDESVVNYTKVFKALLDVAKQAGVTPG